MKTLTFDTVTALNANSTPPEPQREGRFRPRLRRWLKKLRQYGRVELDMDVRGLLHLSLAASLLTQLPKPF